MISSIHPTGSRTAFSLLFALLLGFAGMTLVPSDALAQPGRNSIPKAASMNGKYVKLLRVLNVPNDRATYGDFHDYGYYTGDSWGGYTNLPPGYWVYAAPNWYIWGAQTVIIPQQASVNGKYSRLLKVLNVPGDRANYGDFTDYGYYTGASWAGYTNLPPGYWVYVAPNWYIWGQQ